MCMKVALVYDRITKWGGAERVLLALRELFPDAPLFTSVYDKKKASWAQVFDVKTSFLQDIPISFRHEYYPFFMPMAFENFSFDDFDLVISITSEAAKGIITKPKTIHVCYCLTPTRYLWSGFDEYFKNSTFRFLLKPVISYLRNWDLIAAQRPDYYIAISKEVKGRIKKYYNRESEVIYPPLNIAFSSLASSVQLEDKLNAKKLDAKRSSYFLVVSRLVPYKRIDIVIKACNTLKLQLKIIGTGFEEEKLKKMAGPTVEFLGNLTDSELVGYYKSCRALIFPGNEDFGLTMVEAQSYGKPVIAFRGGGALEIIREGRTGLFFDPQTADACIQVLQVFEKKIFLSSECMKNAQQFSSKLFKKKFLYEIKKIIMENKDLMEKKI